MVRSVGFVSLKLTKTTLRTKLHIYIIGKLTQLTKTTLRTTVSCR